MLSVIGAFNALLRELVAEFTLTDNPANTTTSFLRSLCHVDDSVILGSWLQETDHKAIEDQVSNAVKREIMFNRVPFFIWSCAREIIFARSTEVSIKIIS